MMTTMTAALRSREFSSCDAIVCARVITIGTTTTITTGTTTCGAAAG